MNTLSKNTRSKSFFANAPSNREGHRGCDPFGGLSQLVIIGEDERRVRECDRKVLPIQKAYRDASTSLRWATNTSVAKRSHPPERGKQDIPLVYEQLGADKV